MKRFLLFFSVLLISSSGFSQITATDTLGNPIENGSECIFNRVGSEAGLYLLVTNNSTETISINLVCDEVIGSDGSAIEFCFGSCMYGINPGQIYGPLNIAPGGTTTNGEIDFINHDNSSDIIQYDFTIYEEGNESNAVSFSYIYDANYTSINNLENRSVSLFPNPANDYITLSSERLNSGTVNIVDINGRVVLSDILQNNNKRISVSHLSKGIYFVKLYEEKELVSYQKLIIQ